MANPALRPRILVVDDERDLVELLSLNLEREGYEVAAAFTGPEALASASGQKPDLIVLDVMLPGLSGTEVASRLRTDPRTAGVPILMLSARGEEVDQVVGLAVGADDYVTKPFSMNVLLARIDAMLRRASSGSAASDARRVRAGPIELDTGTHEAFHDGETLKLTLTEYRILASLMMAGGRVLTRAMLMSRAMGPGVTVTDRTIDVHVTSIRKKLGRSASMLRTVRGVGYRLSGPPADAPRAGT